MFFKLIASDEAVKALFDHFRNLGISSAVIAAGIWSWTNLTVGRFWFVNTVSSMCLCALGIFLFAVADLHGRKKFAEANLARFWAFTMTTIYACAVIPLIASVALKAALL